MNKPPTVWRFTFLGMVGLILLTLALAQSEKTGPFVVYALIALILVVLFSNPNNVTQVFLQKETV